MKALNWPAKGISRAEITRQLATKFCITSHRKADGIIDRALTSGIIRKTDGKFGKYYYRGIQMPDDEIEQAQLPFGKPSDDEQVPY